MEPFTREQIANLFKAADYMAEVRNVLRRSFTMRRATANRDHAIILVLLDTGLRVTEMCTLNVRDVDLTGGKVDVKHGIGGGAKGGKGRLVLRGKASRRTVWRYLAECDDAEDAVAPPFLGRLNHRMNKGVLRQMIGGLDENAGCTNCHPRPFRHTFAVTYLRSGGMCLLSGPCSGTARWRSSSTIPASR